MSVINSQPLIGASGNQSTAYNLTRSLRFRSSASAYLNRTPASAGNRRTWTWSGWVKRGNLGSTNMLFSCFFANNDNSQLQLAFNSNNALYVAGYSTDFLITTAVYRDPSAWYHIVCAVDTTSATANNRIRLYVNGSEITTFGTRNNPSQNTDLAINTAQNHFIGYGNFANSYLDGYQTEVNFVDGQVLTPSSFGETDTITGVWKPKKYTGTYGTNGFYLKFDNLTSTSTLGNDSSGNSNTWTVNNISLTSGATYDSMKDVPTLTDADTANYCVLNPIGLGGGTLSNGNLTLSTSTDTASVGTIPMTSGKWYWEVTLTTSSNPRVGVFDIGSANPQGLGNTANGWALINSPSRVFHNGTTTSYGSFVGSSGAVVMVAYDADLGRIWYGEDGTWLASGNPATNSNPSQTSVTGRAIVPAVASGTGANVFDLNCGQRPFAYTPPSGFKALNTFNLPDSTIVAGNKVMDATTYTGTGSSLAISNAGGFKPDFVWIKSRNNAYNNELYDSVRGATIRLLSNLTNAESTSSLGLTSFNSNGFTQGGQTETGANGATYVGWQWQAGQGTNTSNTSGTRTSTVSVNASAGFSIVTYTGNATNATVGHGLGVAPKFIIVKNRGSTDGWCIWHTGIPNTQFLQFTTDAPSTLTTAWNSTSPTSSVFSVGSHSGTNGSSANLVAYCFADVAGYSAFGSYTGNGSADGPFIYTGFRPKFYLFKRRDSAGNWFIFDTLRGTFNISTPILYANRNDAESANTIVDFLSNGIKIRSAVSGDWNANGGTYIYAAFAESPFKNSLAR